MKRQAPCQTIWAVLPSDDPRRRGVRAWRRFLRTPLLNQVVWHRAFFVRALRTGGSNHASETQKCCFRGPGSR